MFLWNWPIDFQALPLSMNWIYSTAYGRGHGNCVKTKGFGVSPRFRGRLLSCFQVKERYAKRPLAFLRGADKIELRTNHFLIQKQDKATALKKQVAFSFQLIYNQFGFFFVGF